MSSSISQVIAALSQPEGDKPSQLSDDILKDAIRLIADGRESISGLVTSIFPNNIPHDSAFYEQLHLVESRLGISEHAALLVGYIWAGAITKLPEVHRETVLSHFLEADNIHFFQSLRALPVVVENVPLSASFLFQWFLRMYARVAKDFAQSYFWRSLEAWALSAPNEAVTSFELLIKDDLDDAKIAIGAAILGNVRVAFERTSRQAVTSKYEEMFSRHGDVAMRLVFHRSWINTAWNRGLSDAEFASCLDRMGGGTSQERSEAFNFLRCVMPDHRITPECIAKGIAWLRNNATPTLPDNSKHWVIYLVRVLAERSITDNTFLQTLWPVLLNVQPIQKQGNDGTWQEVVFLFVALLQKNQPQFECLLRLLLDANPEGLIHQFSSARKFDYLRSQISTHCRRGFYSDLFFSHAFNHRRFAFTLFDELPFEEFPIGTLTEKSDNEIALAFFEFKLHHLEPNSTRIFLLAMLPRIEHNKSQLLDVYRLELIYQAKNFPGAVLEKLRPLSESNKLLRGVVAEVDEYFDRLHKVHRSTINSMEIPGLKRALSMHSKRQSRAIETQSEEFSTIAKMFSNSYLLYGSDSFRYCRDGGIGDASELKMISTEMELPRMSIIDPEGAALRRHEAIQITDRLAAIVKKAKTSDDT